MGLCVSACVSFIFKFCLLRLYMLKRSSVFISVPFFSMCKVSIASSMVLYVCCVSGMCCEYLEFGLLDRIAYTCSLYLVLKFLPVCPIYLSWYSLHFIWYIPFLLYLSVFCFLSWRWFCFVFLVLYAILIFVFFNNFVMVLVYFPVYVNVAHFCFCVVF
jgi:hypothetical protein